MRNYPSSCIDRPICFLTREDLLKPRAIVVAFAITVFYFSASVSGAQTASVPDPVPPRVFFTPGFTGSNAYTLPAKNGYLAAGYAGTDALAQWSGEGDTSLPFIVHAAYGVTNYFTLGLGSGAWRFEADDFPISEIDFFPYLAPKLRVYNGKLLTAGIRGIIVLPTEKDWDLWLYGASLELSTNMTKRAAGHLSIGFVGTEIANEYTSGGVVAVGQDVSVFMFAKGQLKVFGEFRRIAIEEEGSSILIAGARFLSSTAGVEAWFAHWFEDTMTPGPL